jgi:nitrite reductase/ring-hydroxylating ferredoxin subunit
MMDDQWVFAINVDEMVDSEKKPIVIEGNKLLLIKLGGQFYALSNKCPHMGCPLSKGVLEGSAIKCPCHDWEFDIKTGQFLAAKEIAVATYDTKVLEKKLFVNLEGGNQ